MQHDFDTVIVIREKHLITLTKQNLILSKLLSSLFSPSITKNGVADNVLIYLNNFTIHQYRYLLCLP